jgi:hypothetical protein
MVLGLALGFIAGLIVGAFVIGLLAASARGNLEWELANSHELLRAAERGSMRRWRSSGLRAALDGSGMR